MISANDNKQASAAGAPKANEPDVYLTIEGALAELQRLGFDVTYRQMQRYACERKLPFFRFGKSLHIQRSELLLHLKKLQLAAVREVAAAR